MANKQMTIDDYLNTNNAVVMSNAEPVETAEALELEAVDYNNLKKEELIAMLEDRDKLLAHYEEKIASNEEAYKKEMTNQTEYYGKKFKELHNLIAYHERKIKLIGDLVNIETGGNR